MSANGVSHEEGRPEAGLGGVRAEGRRSNAGEEAVRWPGVGDEGELAELAAVRRLQAAGLVQHGKVEAVETPQFPEAA